MSELTQKDIHVRLPQFDGPFDLLLYLVKKDEISIKDIEIPKITQQYLSFLFQMKELNFDIAGEYLYMASTLLHLKSVKCVNESEFENSKKQIDAEDKFNIPNRDELVRRLEQLERFRVLAPEFWGKLSKRNEHIFTRPRVNRKKLFDSLLSPMESDKLTESMMDFLHRESRKYQVLKRDRISIKEKLKALKDTLKEHDSRQFKDLVNFEKGLDDIVITFISLLELARWKKVSINQEEGQGPIKIDVLGDLDDFNVNQADGFESEDENEDEGDENVTIQ